MLGLVAFAMWLFIFGDFYVVKLEPKKVLI